MARKKSNLRYRDDPDYAEFEAFMQRPMPGLPVTDGAYGEPIAYAFNDTPEDLLFLLWKAAVQIGETR